MLAAGGEFISDVGILAAGSTLRRLGYRWFSESRLGEWLRSLTPGDIGGLADATTQATRRAWTAGLGPNLDRVAEPTPLVIDLDATHTETYGLAKEGAEQRNYQGLRGYHPLLAVEATTGQVIATRLRNGNAAPALDAADFTAETIRRVRQLTPNEIPLLIRADSGFYVHDLFAACRDNNTHFSVTVRLYRSIRNQVEQIKPQAWKPISRTPTRRVDIAAIAYQLQGRAKTRPITCRLIIRRVTTPADTGHPQARLFDLVDYHAFVTDQPGDPATLWHRHRGRANIEAVIRDLKYGLGLNHFPSGSSTANAAWLHINILTHNLCRFTNKLITPQPLTTKTLRHRYFALPGRITTRARTTTLHLPTGWPHQPHITNALTALHHLNAA